MVIRPRGPDSRFRAPCAVAAPVAPPLAASGRDQPPFRWTRRVVMLVAVFLVAGFVLLFLLLLSTQKAGPRAAARVSLVFIVIWLLATAGYVWYGVAPVSYTHLTL